MRKINVTEQGKRVSEPEKRRRVEMMTGIMMETSRLTGRTVTGQGKSVTEPREKGYFLAGGKCFGAGKISVMKQGE